VLRRLAETLHRQHLGAVSLLRGLDAAEISDALRTLAGEGNDGPLGLGPPERRPQWKHVRLHPLTFDRLALVVTEPGEGAGTSGSFGGRGAELWLGLAQAAIAGEALGQPDAGTPVPLEPEAVAQAIDQHHGAEAYDQVIVGHLLQIAQELRGGSPVEHVSLRRRTSRLIAKLRPDTLRRLVEMGGNVAQRRAFVMDATHGMAVDAVLEILKAAGDISGQTISQGLVRMLSKLAAQAEGGGERARPVADAALREQVGRLLSGWELTDPNPEAYGRFLQRVTSRATEDEPAMAPDASDRPEPLRVVQMSLEIDGVGPLLTRAVDRAVDDRQTTALLDLLASPPASASSAAAAVHARLVSARTMGRLIGHHPVDFDSIDRLLPDLPPDAFNPLLDTLATSDNRTVRRRLLDRLAKVETDISSLVTSRLYDGRWFVQRNMLVLLERSGRAPNGFSASTWATHLDPRVRHQAIRLQLTLPQERDHAIRAALEDGDPRLLRVGLVALQASCPASMARPVIAVSDDVFVDEEHRILAVNALGRCRAVEALEALLRLVDGGKTLLGRPRLPPRTPLVLAAVRALAGAWSTEPRAAAILALAGRSSDPELRKAAGAVRP
jgi:hypothetical protein